LLALAGYNDREVEQLDVVTAFLEADIEEEIYMRQPERIPSHRHQWRGASVLVEEIIVWLKQAPRNWNETITAWLEDYGFT
jgi:hypothetical protein